MKSELKLLASALIDINAVEPDFTRSESYIKHLCEEQWERGGINSTWHKAGWRLRNDFFGAPIALIANERKIPKYRGKRDDRYTKTALELYRRMITQPMKPSDR